jgi:hypothetical protein
MPGEDGEPKLLSSVPFGSSRTNRISPEAR